MTPYNNAIIPLQHIETKDKYFQISTGSIPDNLIASINDIGLTTSPWLLKKEKNYIIVSGFKRIEACRRLDCESIAANVLDAGTPDIHCVKLSISDNAFHRSLNLVEQARAYHLLEKNVSSSAELVETALVAGLPNPPEIIRKIASITQASASLQQIIISEIVTLSMALEIMGMPDEAAHHISLLFQELKPGLNRQREYVSLISEIAQRENISISDIFHCEAVKTILNDEKKDYRQKANSLRHYLKARRFPELDRKQRHTEDLIRAIHPGPGIKIVPPPFFEGAQYMIQLNFSSPAQLKTLQDKMNRILQSTHLNDLFS